MHEIRVLRTNAPRESRQHAEVEIAVHRYRHDLAGRRLHRKRAPRWAHEHIVHARCPKAGDQVTHLGGAPIQVPPGFEMQDPHARIIRAATGLRPSAGRPVQSAA